MANHDADAIAQLESTLASVAASEEAMKWLSTRYDLAAKLDAMRDRGLTWDEVDLPFEQWMALKADIARERERKKNDGEL